MSSIPQELFQPIVEHISLLPNLNERAHGLASVALVSRHLRCLAHAHLFSTICFDIKEEPQMVEKGMMHHLRNLVMPAAHSAVGRLRSLSKLIDTNPESELPSYIRSFKLAISGAKWTAEDLLNDHAFSDTLNKLFRQGHGHCSLIISTELVDRPDVPSMRGIDWEDMKQETKEAIWSACQRPLVRHLHLGFLNNVPHDMLLASHIRHLTLSEITLSKSMLSATPSGSGHATHQLISLKLDQSVPIHQLLEPIAENSSNAPNFDHLTALDMTVFNSAGVQITASILGHAPVLETLTIRIEPRQASGFHPLDCSHLRHLQHLRMEISSNPTNDAIIDARSILDMKTDVPQSLRQITILFKLTGTDDPFKGQDLSILDQQLAHPRYIDVKTITIRCRFWPPKAEDLHNHKWKQDKSKHLLESFPALAMSAREGKKRVRLLLDEESH